MLKNKTYLVGLGSGLILGAVLLQLMWKVDQLENKSVNLGSLTAEQVRSEAERLNLKVYTQQQVEELKAKAAEDEKARLAKTAGTPTGTAAGATGAAGAAATPSAPATPAPANTPTPPAANTAAATPAPSPTPTIRSVFIPDKTDATSVANLLVQSQILTEPTKFIALLEEQKLSGRIRFGYHEFANNADVADVVRIITLP
ncbi:hypothetical protein [Paenibacillus sp. HJGM_3]|uniref:hypothetical protein n=1 Tax=Paenibacillus sp. HJGM_3 TaxID=3379816 RepID=UPI00385C3C54